MTQLTGQGKLPIFAQSETMFFLKVVDAQLEFAADASAVVLHQGGRSQKATRQPQRADPAHAAWVDGRGLRCGRGKPHLTQDGTTGSESQQRGLRCDLENRNAEPHAKRSRS